MPPTFKPDIQRILLKKKSYTKPQKREYIYGTITLYGRLFQGVPLDSILPRRGPTTPMSPRRHGFGLFRVRSPLLTESLFIFSSYGYLDVSVPHVRLPYGMTGLQPAGLPHSEI